MNQLVWSGLFFLAMAGGLSATNTAYAADLAAPAFPVIAHLHDRLNLTTSQQVLWDAAVAQTATLRETASAARTSIRQTLDAELAKSEPDLAQVAAAVDAAQAQTVAARKAARGAWLNLYATFSSEQKSVVRDAMSSALARFDGIKAHLRDWLFSRG